MDRGFIMHVGTWTVLNMPIGQIWLHTNEYNFYLN